MIIERSFFIASSSSHKPRTEKMIRKTLFLSACIFFILLLAATAALIYARRFESQGTIEDLATERQSHRNQRNIRRAQNNPKFDLGSASASKPEQQQEAEAAAAGDNEDGEERSGNGAKILKPEVMGRGRHGWSHQARRHKEELATDKANDLKKVHPFMEGMTTEERAGVLLLGRLEHKFRDQVGMTRTLLHRLRDLTPSQAITDRYERMEQELKEQEHAKRDDVVQLKRITALEGAVARLEYQLADVKNFATEVAGSAQNVQERQKELVEEHKLAEEKLRKECEAAANNQELRVQALEKELLGKNEEVTELQSALNSLGGDAPLEKKSASTADSSSPTSSSSEDGADSSSSKKTKEHDEVPPAPRAAPASKIRLLLVRHTEIILIVAAIAIPLLFVAGYSFGKSRGKVQGIALAKKNADIFREKETVVAAGAAGRNNTSSPLSPSGNEIKNRTLQKFDDGV